MIYVVLGVPNTIYRSAQSETWIYGTVNNPVSINFFFKSGQSLYRKRLRPFKVADL